MKEKRNVVILTTREKPARRGETDADFWPEFLKEEPEFLDEEKEEKYEN